MLKKEQEILMILLEKFSMNMNMIMKIWKWDISSLKLSADHRFYKLVNFTVNRKQEEHLQTGLKNVRVFYDTILLISQMMKKFACNYRV